MNVNSGQRLSKTHLGIAIAICSAIVFGIYPAATRAAYADGANTSFVIILTTWFRALSLAIFCLLSRKPLFQTRKDTTSSATGGLFQSLSILGIIGGLAFLPGPLVIIIVFTHTLMLLFFLASRGEIILNATTILTTLVALAGLSLVLDIWKPQSGDYLIGMGLAFMSALATVSRLYVYGHQTQTRNPAVIGAENFLVAAAILSFMAIFQMPHPPATSGGYVWALLGCVSLTLGSFGMFYGIALLGSFRWSLFLKLEPIFTALFSTLFLSEILKIHQYIGMLVVIGSLAIYQIAEQRRKIPA